MESSAPLPESWSRMLENVNQALAQADSELALAEVPVETIEAQAAERAARWQLELRRLDGLGRELKERTRQAEEKARTLQDSLGQTEESLRGWLAKAATMREQLGKLTQTSL